MLARAAMPLCALLVAAGCGSGAPLPPAAGPARSPALGAAPAGRVVDVGPGATGLFVDGSTGEILVVRRGGRAVTVDPDTLRVSPHVRGLHHTPPPSASLPDGAVVRLDRVRRRLHVEPAGGKALSAPAGLGPTHVAIGAGGRLYVTDTGGGSVLLFRRGAELELVRRAALPGRPYAAAVDRERGTLWVTVTATNEVARLTADGAPRLRARVPAVRQPNAIAVDERRGRVYVLGAGGRLQAFDGSRRS